MQKVVGSSPIIRFHKAPAHFRGREAELGDRVAGAVVQSCSHAVMKA